VYGWLLPAMTTPPTQAAGVHVHGRALSLWKLMRWMWVRSFAVNHTTSATPIPGSGRTAGPQSESARLRVDVHPTRAQHALLMIGSRRDACNRRLCTDPRIGGHAAPAGIVGWFGKKYVRVRRGSARTASGRRCRRRVDVDAVGQVVAEIAVRREDRKGQLICRSRPIEARRLSSCTEARLRSRPK